MIKLLATIGMFIGSYAGWALGAPFGFFTAFMVSGVGAGVGFRAVVADRMPVVGPLPDPAAPAQDPDDVAVAGGLYAIGAFASRGLIWSALAGEILASAIVGEPLPVETDLARAVDPGRFLRRAARRGVRRARPPDPRG